MTASFLPTLLVPTVGLVFPAVAMAALFLYVERGQATAPTPAAAPSAPAPVAEETPQEGD